MSKRIFCLVSAVLLLVCVSLPVFADNAGGNGLTFVNVCNTTCTMTGLGTVTSGNRTTAFRPVARYIQAVKYLNGNGVHINLYPAMIDQDYTPLGTLDTGFVIPIATEVSDGLSVDITPVNPYDIYGGFTPWRYSNPFWLAENQNGITYDELYPADLGNDISSPTTYQNGILGYRAWTTESANAINFESLTVLSVNHYYTAPTWYNSIPGRIELGANSNLANRRLVYNAMMAGGYHTMVFQCQRPDGGTPFDVYLQWVGFDGGTNYQITATTPQGSGATNTGSSYNAGYAAGVTDAENRLNGQIQQSYVDGYEAAQENSGLIPSSLLAIGEIPFTMFRQILDFEVFGFDVSILVSLIVTGIAVIWITKLFL